jgi:hypothetical protein
MALELGLKNDINSQITVSIASSDTIILTNYSDVFVEPYDILLLSCHNWYIILDPLTKAPLQ